MAQKSTWSSWISQARRALKQWWVYRLRRQGIDYEEYDRPSAASVPMILILLVTFGAGYTLDVVIGNLKSQSQSTVQNEASIGRGLVRSSENTTNEKNAPSDKCKLSESWRPSLGTLNQEVGDETLIFLPQNSSRGLFKYEGSVNQDAECDFSFVPRSDQAINYVISFDEFYQIVVGDNDYRTLSLRAADIIGGPLDPVVEVETNTTRPRLMHPIKKGSEVVVTIKQGERNNDNYEVSAEVKYSPDIPYNKKKETEVFVWQFVQSPILEVESPDLSIGLIRGVGDDSYIGSNFISPNPAQGKTE